MSSKIIERARESFVIPKWVPSGVATEALRIHEDETWDHGGDDLIHRLTTDERMKSVWKTLFKRSDNASKFTYPTKLKSRRTRRLHVNEKQDIAAASLFCCAFYNEALRFPGSVLTEAELSKLKTRYTVAANQLLKSANVLKDLRLRAAALSVEAIANEVRESWQDVLFDDPFSTIWVTRRDRTRRIDQRSKTLNAQTLSCICYRARK